MVYGMQNGNTKEFQPFNLTFNLLILVSQVNKALWTKEMQKLNRFQTKLLPCSFKLSWSDYGVVQFLKWNKIITRK